MFGIKSCLRANTNAFGIVAPRRLSIIALGIATTSALTVRVHCACIGTAGAAAVAPAVVVADAPVVAAGGVAGTGTVVVAGVIVSVGAAAKTGVVISATGLFTAAAGVCAPMLTALSKQNVITVNEVTMGTGISNHASSRLLNLSRLQTKH